MKNDDKVIQTNITTKDIVIRIPKKFILEDFDKETKRRELGIVDADFMIISVGELNENKNQEVVIRAIAKIKKDNIHYFIAGKGDKEQYLIDLARKLAVRIK